MKSSLADVAEVPDGVVTVTLTVPAASAGSTAVICVAEFTTKLVAAVAAELHRRGPREVRAGDDDGRAAGRTGPELGLTAVTVGAAAAT